jgi:phosphohistidine swiveling domain-containing protein
VSAAERRFVPSPPFEQDPLRVDSDPDIRWTTANTGEQMPGVLSPLTITITAEPAEVGFRDAFGILGIVPRSEVRMPARRTDLQLGYFYGRCAANVKVIREFFDLTPGTSGAAYEEQMFGGDGLGESTELSRRRYPIVAVKMPLGLLRAPAQLRRLRAELQEWWGETVARMPTATFEEARAACADAEQRMRAVVPHVWIATMAAQLAYGRLVKVVADAGHAGLETTVAGGYGTEEMDMANDLWATSRGRMTKEQFLGIHGWTVPLGMELSESSWRERPEALDGLLENYARLGPDDDPAVVARRRAQQREAAERHVLRALPIWRRPDARLTLKMANEYMQLRTIQKAANAVTWDVMRAAARRMGELLVADGRLDAPDDVFQLTAGELLDGPIPADAKALVAQRAAQHEEYLNLRLPSFWTGNPDPIPITDDGPDPTATVSGVGVSPGIVEGPVRVVTSPTDAEVQTGEILVCETTDPSWIALMVVAAGLVIDVGGPVSHGAIVARELGVPCVINTRNGTTALRTGQRVRIDGTTGAVEILDVPS